MKKILCVILVAVLMVGLVGCKGDVYDNTINGGEPLISVQEQQIE